jgi:hypothetical protein
MEIAFASPMPLKAINFSTDNFASSLMFPSTKLKILFYTGLAVLLLGFIYTNKTLQRAQSRNLKTNITLH